MLWGGRQLHLNDYLISMKLKLIKSNLYMIRQILRFEVEWIQSLDQISAFLKKS